MNDGGGGSLGVPMLESGLLRRDPVHKADRLLYTDLMKAREDDLFLIEESDDADTKERLKGILRKQLTGLLKADPFVGLKSALEDSDWDLNSEDVRIGSFGLIYPSLKALNDVYLGQINADNFMIKVQELIKDKLGGDSAPRTSVDIFYMNSKGGSFLFDLRKFAVAHGVERPVAIQKLKEVLKDLQTDITAILQAEIQSRMLELTSEEHAREARILELDESHGSGESFDVADEKSKLEEQLRGIRGNKDNLGRLSFSLAGTQLGADGSVAALSSIDTIGELSDGTGAHTVPGYLAHVSFCLNKPEIGGDPAKVDDVSLYLSLLNAQRGVAMNALRTFKIPREGQSRTDVRASYAMDASSGEVVTLPEEEIGEEDAAETDSVRKNGESMRSVVQEFSYVHFLMDLARARDGVISKVLDITGEGAVCIKPEWSDFFYLDEDSNVRMKGEMIMQFRKERLSREYTGALADTGRRRVFAKYYDNINVIDVLKNFRLEKTENYKSRVENLLDLVGRIKEALGSEDTDVNVLRDLARSADRELGVLVKDEGGEIVRTVRAAIANLFTEGNRAMLFVDHIGFGRMNQASHEQIVIDLINMLEIAPAELDDIRAAGEMGDSAQKAVKWNLLISRKFEDIRRNPSAYREFVRLLLSVGDEGTAHLRDVEGRLYRLFTDIGVTPALAVGGDEVAVFIGGVPDEYLNEGRFKGLLEDVSAECRLRAFGILQGGQPDASDPTISTMLSRYIRARRRAEMAHGGMKKQGDMAPVEVIGMRELLLG